MLTQPEMTSAPGSTWRGTDSPVSAAVSSWEVPSVTTPSMGTRSPGLTTIVVPGATSAGSSSTAMDLRLWPTA